MREVIAFSDDARMSHLVKLVCASGSGLVASQQCSTQCLNRSVHAPTNVTVLVHIGEQSARQFWIERKAAEFNVLFLSISIALQFSQSSSRGYLTMPATGTQDMATKWACQTAHTRGYLTWPATRTQDMATESGLPVNTHTPVATLLGLPRVHRT